VYSAVSSGNDNGTKRNKNPDQSKLLDNCQEIEEHDKTYTEHWFNEKSNNPIELCEPTFH
jgi:hypothetical protein